MTLAPKLIIITFLFTALISIVTSSILRGQSAMNREQRLLVDASLQTSGNVQERAGNKTIYFGYGSNLWQRQMATRCSESLYLGLARLDGYKWIIYSRQPQDKGGYANIVQTNKEHDVVYGMVYALGDTDEARLDKNEGVPHAYTKEVVKTKFWPVKNPHKPSKEPAETRDWVDVKNKTLSQDIGMLVYINREKIEETKPWEEYISRMNAGIKDAMTCGIPEEYVSQVIRPFIPEDKLAVPYSWGSF